MRFLGPGTNNVAEYTALIIGLEEAWRHEVEDLEVRMDSKLVVEQMNGKWRVRDAKLRPLADRARDLLGPLPEVAPAAHPARSERASRISSRTVPSTRLR